MNTDNVQVYRITPTDGKFYYYAEWDTREGDYPRERYFADKEKVVYVGKYIGERREGYRDNVKQCAIFDLNGKEICVVYSYEGKTCFLEYKSS